MRVVGKGGRERIVPIDRPFFTELAAYLREERPPGAATPECFVVLHGPTRGNALSEAGLRSVFRHHRTTSGALRVRPHRLRHTYETEFAGIDLRTAQLRLGHSDPRLTLTLAVYAQATSEADRRAAERLGQRLMDGRQHVESGKAAVQAAPGASSRPAEVTAASDSKTEPEPAADPTTDGCAMDVPSEGVRMANVIPLNRQKRREVFTFGPELLQRGLIGGPPAG